MAYNRSGKIRSSSLKEFQMIGITIYVQLVKFPGERKKEDLMFEEASRSIDSLWVDVALFSHGRNK